MIPAACSVPIGAPYYHGGVFTTTACFNIETNIFKDCFCAEGCLGTKLEVFLEN
jgi:hypothetical protein